MTALIAWLDASSEDQRRMREIVNLFAERESREELGIGTVRDALSDALWPGTSTLHTRARYFLFIPWAYREAATKRNDIGKALSLGDSNERRLIAALKEAGETSGVIGANVGSAVKNLPSVLYWSALRTHGILNDSALSLDDAVTAEVDRVHARRPADFEDASTNQWVQGAFHATLPPAPLDFPQEIQNGFSLTREEAAWLRDRMLTSAPGTLLEHALQQRPDASSVTPWDDTALMEATGEPARLLDDARRFSTLMNGAALLYNLLLAEAYEQESFDRVENPVDNYRERLRAWAEIPNLAADIASWDRGAFWTRVQMQNPRVHPLSRRFVDSWVDSLQTTSLSGIADNIELRTFIARRERQQKGGQARLANKRLLQSWLGSAGSGRLIYRWNNVRPILHDIQDGLERIDA